MSTAQAAPSNSLVLHGIDWRTYARLLRLFNERRSIRLTYDRGDLEIMTLSPEHENLNLLLNHLVVAAAEELGLEIASYGSMTMRRRGRRRGLEADQCYWIANEARMRGRDRIDLRTDPPPDLVIEVDVSRSSLDRMTIYATLRVPEVWRLDSEGFCIQLLGPNGQYAPRPNSLSFPAVAASAVAGFLALRGQVGENALVRQFRDWIRQQVAGGAPPQPTP
jgi:Uma2 family endonuclease